MAIIMLMAFTQVEACSKHHKHKQRHQVKKGPPVWAQAHGYRIKQVHRFTYFPEYNIYYDQRREVFLYVDAGVWRMSVNLPYPVRMRNLRRTYSVELNLSANNPVANNAYHIKRYRKYGKRRYYADGYGR